jgi:hypothetical protein
MKKAKTTRKSLNRKLLYTVLLATIVLSALLVTCYLFLQSRREEWTAAIVDQLAVEDILYNPEFNNACTQLLTTSGYSVKYYPGKDVTINFYEELPSKGSKIMLVRAHSAVRENTTYVDLFTSEVYQESLANGVYAYLAVNRHISKASFYLSNTKYFAVGPSFISSVMKGSFSDCFIVLMGCNSLNQTSMAEALVGRGAKVVVGWTGNVTVSDTDTCVLRLLDLLLEEDYTVRYAVDKVNQNHPLNGTRLDYYPKDEETGSYRVPTRKSVASFTLSHPTLYCFASTSAVGGRGIAPLFSTERRRLYSLLRVSMVPLDCGFVKTTVVGLVFS